MNPQSTQSGLTEGLPRAQRAGSLLFQPFPIGKGGLVLPNRIWLPAMVTWRGTEDGFVTPSVREIYLRYALGGAGMIVLEATGIRDVASGPLLRLSHERFVPGLKALREEMRAVSASIVVPQIIDFLKIATRKPTRVFMEDAVRRGMLAESVLDVADIEFEAGLERYVRSPRLRHDFLYGYRQTIEDLSRDEIRQIPGWFASAAQRAKQAGFDGVVRVVVAERATSPDDRQVAETGDVSFDRVHRVAVLQPIARIGVAAPLHEPAHHVSSLDEAQRAD